MFQFLESICFKDGRFQLLELHQQRINRTFASYYPAVAPHEIQKLLPTDFTASKKHKFRFLYDSEAFEISHAPYTPKVIHSVKIVHADQLDYSFKFADRSEINSLLIQAGTDEVIFVKNGLVTDCSYANLAFFDGNKWYTPRQPLLKGIKRASLVQKGFIQEEDISPNEIHTFKKACLINVMLDMDDQPLNLSTAF